MTWSFIRCKLIRGSLFSSGIILLALNISGLFFPLRNSDIFHELGVRDNNGGISLTEKEMIAKAHRKPGESVQNYVMRLNAVVNQGMAHYWGGPNEKSIDRYNIRIPLHENYLLFLASYIYPAIYKRYEFSDYRKGIERGVGLCSQHAIIATELLKKNGVDAYIVGLSGHVVASAKIDKEKKIWWVLDPDYGVVVRHSLEEIEADTEIITSAYLEAGISKKIVDALVLIYGKDGNNIYRSVLDYSGWKKYYIEYFSYILIWAIPVALLLSVLANKFRPKIVFSRMVQKRVTAFTPTPFTRNAR